MIGTMFSVPWTGPLHGPVKEHNKMMFGRIKKIASLFGHTCPHR